MDNKEKDHDPFKKFLEGPNSPLNNLLPTLENLHPSILPTVIDNARIPDFLHQYEIVVQLTHEKPDDFMRFEKAFNYAITKLLIENNIVIPSFTNLLLYINKKRNLSGSFKANVSNWFSSGLIKRTIYCMYRYITDNNVSFDADAEIDAYNETLSIVKLIVDIGSEIDPSSENNNESKPLKQLMIIINAVFDRGQNPGYGNPGGSY